MNTPSSSALLRFCLAAGACISLSSCYSGSGYGGGYGGGYSGYRSYGPSYGYGYRSSSRCSSCGRSPCSCGRRHYDHDDHRKHGSSHSKNDSHNYKIVSGSVGTKTKPTGAHSLGWYKSRGYDTSRLAFKDQHGHTKTGSNYRSSGSSSSRSYTSTSSRSSGSKKSSASSNRSNNNNNNNRSASNRSNNNNNNNNSNRNRSSGGGGGKKSGGGGKSGGGKKK